MKVTSIQKAQILCNEFGFKDALRMIMARLKLKDVLEDPNKREFWRATLHDLQTKVKIHRV